MIEWVVTRIDKCPMDHQEGFIKMSELTMVQKEILTLFISSADKREKTVAGVSEKDLDHSMGPDEWTIHHVAH